MTMLSKIKKYLRKEYKTYSLYVRIYTNDYIKFYAPEYVFPKNVTYTYFDNYKKALGDKFHYMKNMPRFIEYEYGLPKNSDITLKVSNAYYTHQSCPDADYQSFRVIIRFKTNRELNFYKLKNSKTFMKMAEIDTYELH